VAKQCSITPEFSVSTGDKERKSSITLPVGVLRASDWLQKRREHGANPELNLAFLTKAKRQRAIQVSNVFLDSLGVRVVLS
jgi:hypothetical protein